MLAPLFVANVDLLHVRKNDGANLSHSVISYYIHFLHQSRWLYILKENEW